MSSRVDIRHALWGQIRPAVPAKRTRRAEAPGPSPRWVPWIFAAKTTASALLALLVAFTFDLDAPKWSLLTVFIVAQPQSGLVLAPAFAQFDARRKFATASAPQETGSICISGAILQGKRKPPECPAFGTTCTPEHPLGATMVSSEGACAAYHRYRKAPTA